MPTSDDSRDLIEVLGEDFTRRLRRGEHPSVEEYAEQYPSRAEDIRELLPTIAALEQIRGTQGTDSRLLAHDCPSQLGDFRLLKEIGRGGMGVVYEAEQISLGRTVAVKVLPRDTSSKAERRAKRFDREARMAAKLHHTNIVPVFGVGEAEGFHFLVMQRIRGLALDRMLARLATMESRDPGEDLTDERLPATGVPTSAPSTPSTPSAPSGISEDSRSVSDSTLNPSPDSAAGETRTVGGVSPSKSHVMQSTRLHRRIRHVGGADYWRRAAASAADVADALAYAHDQGILHRDIKPANLLLDDDGVIWIADFGLARIREMDLSHSEDMAGTLRYMAPERFEGRCDVTSDVYSLGATLYEMLVLRPAFRTSERANMVKEITENGPTPPRRVRADVPRDLENVVMKAMALSPADRYRSARDLSDDLRRFAQDRPVHARRATIFERGWRWCRRNRLIALTTSVALLALMTTTIVSSVAYYRTNLLLEQKLWEQRRTANAMSLSFDALDKLYAQFAPDDLFMASLPSVDSADSSGLVMTERPMLSPRAGAMFEQLLGIYDLFAAQVGAEEEVLRRKLISSRRLGAIQLRLGQFEEAEKTFSTTLRRWPKPKDVATQLERARLLNSLGGLYDAIQRRGDARERYYEALQVVESISLDDTSVWSAASYQRAQSHYLLGRSQFFFNTGRSRGDRRQHLEEAIEQLERVIDATGGRSDDGFPGGGADPSFRRLLALCYRELNTEHTADGVDLAIRILSSLCKEFPADLSYQYDLSETLGLPATRNAETAELELARARLLDAIDISAKLVEAQPNLPLYAESRSHLHRKLADVLFALGERDEAAKHADLAVEIHQRLRDTFPSSLNYRVWAAMLVEMRARMQSDYMDQVIAYVELQTVVDELTDLLQSQPTSLRVIAPLSSAYYTLARVQFQQYNFREGVESLQRANLLRDLADIPNVD
ncbi:MAG: serine/threonine protein kinase [Planctomycetales bacterium]|nr:serine/threonine protein kinase [Planctomycetales bacterium]